MKKKMMYGGKVKKMAQGGTTRTQDKIKDLGPNKGTKRIKGRRIVKEMTDEIFALGQKKINASPAQKKEINKLIAAKRAGIKANNPIDKKTGKALSVGQIAGAIDFPKTFGKDVQYDTKSTIPTKTNTQKDNASKEDKKTRDILNKERKREKKAGGKVKKMMGGGMAMKYKHGGKVGKKCPRDGIAMKGKTRA